MLTLWHGPTSVCSQKARMALVETGLEWESRLVDLGKGEQFKPEYMALNPEAVVPTLVHDGKVIRESSLIIEYLDRLAGAGLMPEDTQAEFETRLWLLRCLAIHEAINTMSFATSGRDRDLSTLTPEQIEERLASMPNPQARVKRRDLYDKASASPYVDGALFTLERAFADMSKALVESPWLSGDRFGIADIALMAYVDRLARIAMDGLWAGRHPGVADWLAAIRARSSYAVAVKAFIPDTAAEKQHASGLAHWPAIAAKLA